MWACWFYLDGVSFLRPSLCHRWGNEAQKKDAELALSGVAKRWGSLDSNPASLTPKLFFKISFLKVLTFTTGSLKKKMNSNSGRSAEASSHLPVGRSGQGLRNPVGKGACFLPDGPPNP